MDNRSCLSCVLAAPFAVLALLFVWATACGLRTPSGVININLFPPSITNDLTPASWWVGLFSVVAVSAAAVFGLILFAGWCSRMFRRFKRRRFEELEDSGDDL